MKELMQYEENYATTKTGLDIKSLFKRLRKRLNHANYSATNKSERPARPYELIRLFNIVDWKCVYCDADLFFGDKNVKNPVF